MVQKRRIRFSTTQIIMGSFLLAVLFGSALLSLPFARADGVSVSYVDALFTATTATCVTGLVTVPTVSTWSVFGQIVILVLIQIGGVGVVTVMTGLLLLLNRKMNISNRLLIQDAFNLNTMASLASFVRKVLIGTFLIEGAGALLFMFVFVPDFGARGIWISVFHAVSAFCNAGMDIFSEVSLCDYATNPLIIFGTSALILLGGIGYIVWWDVIRVLKKSNKKNRRVFRHLTLHSKIAIAATVVLTLIGTLLIFALEHRNPATIGNLSLPDQLQVSFFQSVTTRTAGFASVPQENLTIGSSLVSLLLMLIGGSPVGTAGGIKTVTVVILIGYAVATIRNQNEVSLFGRSISRQALGKAVAVSSMGFAILFLSALLLSVSENAGLSEILFEAVSATATVGLSKNLTASLSLFGKCVVIVTMYLGRVGPISLAILLGTKKENQNIVKAPVEEISVG